MSENQELTYENVKNALNIIQKTRESLLFKAESLENALFSFHYVSKSIGKVEDVDWTESEITGYSEENLMHYRKNVYGTFVFDNVGFTIPDELKNEDSHIIFSSIPKLLELCSKNEAHIIFGLGKNRVDEINKKYGIRLNHNQISLDISRTTFIELFGTVKLELINRLDKSEKFCKKYLEEHKGEEKNVEDEQVIIYDPKKIFIVHGRDDVVKTELYHILNDNLKLEPIILNDQANGGKTLIEKFENHTLKVGFVFILLTPDDIGCLRSDFDKNSENPSEAIKKLSIRARENVILELGYFVGSLGRTRVCCIQKGETELVPSDLHGLVTIRYKDSVRDKYLDIEKELKNAGYLK